jgi:hypothetical protein
VLERRAGADPDGDKIGLGRGEVAVDDVEVEEGGDGEDEEEEGREGEEGGASCGKRG